MIYKVTFTTKVTRIINKLPIHLSDLLKDELKKIAVNPRVGEKLAGKVDTYRFRLGKYRIIYEIKDKELIILVLNFGHKKEVYRDR